MFQSENREYCEVFSWKKVVGLIYSKKIFTVSRFSPKQCWDYLLPMTWSESLQLPEQHFLDFSKVPRSCQIYQILSTEQDTPTLFESSSLPIFLQSLRKKKNRMKSQHIFIYTWSPIDLNKVNIFSAGVVYYLVLTSTHYSQSTHFYKSCTL